MGLQQPSIHWGELDSLANGDECSPNKSNLEWNLVHCLDINHQENDHLLGVFVNIWCFLCQRLEMGWLSPFTIVSFLQMAWNYQTTDMRSSDMKWVRDPKKKESTIIQDLFDHDLRSRPNPEIMVKEGKSSMAELFRSVYYDNLSRSLNQNLRCLVSHRLFAPVIGDYWGTTTYQDGSKKEGSSLSLTRLGTLWVLVWTTLS